MFMALALLAGSALALTANAAETGAKPNGAKPGLMRGLGRKFGQMKPGVFGTVSTISGNILTVNGRTGFGSSTPATVFTVDATNAKITKNNTTGSIASIIVGDMVMVQGTVLGSNITATMIRDGVMRGGQGQGKGNGADHPLGSSSPAITGNGQPVVAGTISTISGTTITITNKSNVTYTIDASNAKIMQGQNATVSLANLKIGDTVVVQGAVSGNSVTASSIIDQVQSTGSNEKPARMGFLGGIGQFFNRLFGF